MHKKIRSAASESGYKLQTLYNEPMNLTISNGKAPLTFTLEAIYFIFGNI